MIEIWRQCVTVAGYSAEGGGFEYVAVGALRAGGVLREVRLNFVSTGGVSPNVFMALSGTPIADATSFAAATSLIDGPTTIRHLGKPGFLWRIAAFTMDQMVFPFSVRVDSGSRWVYVGWAAGETRTISMVATATVMGFARMGANGLGVEDGLDK